VEHGYFSDGLCQSLTYVPSSDANTVIKNTGLLIRYVKNGVRVFYDENNSESLQLYAGDPEEPLSLGFKVFSTDPFFESYTEPTVHKEDTILYFDNRGVDIDSDGKYRLHDEEYVSEADFQRLHSPSIEKHLSKRDILVRPAFIVNINTCDKEGGLFDDQSGVTSKSYYLRFQTRQTYWKYYLLGDLATEGSIIVDLGNETEFESIGEESLADRTEAWTFRSKTTLPLRERPEYRFQLKETNSRSGKVLIKRLPVASASQISREVVDGEEAFVSEMFINS
jgi:hypothetical protein